ncbi:MAG: TolC family protein [Acidobacteriota bacterium]|jgi:outer membrane protein TolC
MKCFFEFVALLTLIFIWNASGRAAPVQMPEPQPPSPSGSAPAPSTSQSLSPPGTTSPFLGSVPSGEPTPGELPLSLTDAVERGLQYNLGALLSGQNRRAARGARQQALSKLLPNLSAGVSETVEQVNLAALGFSGFPGIPQIIGPFSVFDVRAYARQDLFNMPSIQQLHSSSETVKATDLTYQNARDLVVLGVVGLYLQAISGRSRIDAAQAQYRTAQALYKQAVDFKEAGVVPAIEVLRSQVEMQSEQQRLIYLQNEFEKQKLNLARTIGLPMGQAFRLTDEAPFRPLPPITFEQALSRAYDSRSDFQSAQAQVRAASLAKQAAESQRLPTAGLDFNYGTIGRAPGSSHGTFTLAASLKVPLFEGGRIAGEVLEADSRLQERQDELENLRAQIRYQVQTSFLDLHSAENQVSVAQSTVNLAHQQMDQARDRFAAGVATNIEVVQAQAALATANENYISSLFAYNLAKAELARAVGGAEKIVAQFLLGETR